MDIITMHITADFGTLAPMGKARKLYQDAVLVLPGSKAETVKRFLKKNGIPGSIPLTHCVCLKVSNKIHWQSVMDCIRWPNSGPDRRL